MTNPKEQVREKIEEVVVKNAHNLSLMEIQEATTELTGIFLDLLHSDREAVMESSKKISYIYPDFDRNGLVRETADKINEIIDAVNLLSPNK